MELKKRKDLLDLIDWYEELIKTNGKRQAISIIYKSYLDNQNIIIMNKKSKGVEKN